MSVRFIVGRAGSGKTWRCLEAIRARLRDHPGDDGPRLLLLVPEQASFQMERALIETPDVAAFTRCEVLSFARLAFRIFASTGADPRRADQTIGPLGRLMAVRRLIRREKSALRLLGRVADKPGLVKQVAATLDELMREDVEPASLAEMADRIDADNPLAAARLADITRLYQAYLDYLIDDRLDPAQYLHLAADRIAQCDWLAGAEVRVDGFAGFTQQEYTLLARLARHAADMEITLLVDPEASAIEATELPRTSYSLFARTERTLVRLRREFQAAGVAVDAPVRLTGDASPRFAAPALARLEHHLFRSAAPHDATPTSPDTIRLVELPDRRSEVQAAVAEIRRLTREATPPMRCRDIAVIVRDLEPYHDLLSAAMRACGIPFFIDRRQPTTHHPLIELVRGLLAMATDDCRTDAVRMTLKTGLLPVADDDGDLLENYLLAHGIAGRSSWDEPWHYTRIFTDKRADQGLTPTQQAVLDRVNVIRLGWLDAVGGWLDAAADGAEVSGRVWADGLFACLDRNDVGRRLQGWADEAEADGLSDEADGHRQVWTDFVELLDEFVHALGTEPMRIGEFREAIEAGLAEFNLGLTPPTLDQVLVGAIERSRHPPIRAALLLGFDEQHYPMKRSEDPLLGDAERELLASADVEIGPSRRRQLLDERMLAYVALTRASERVWISCPRTTDDGKPLEPSPYLDDVRLALPSLVTERIDDPGQVRSPTWITRVGEMGARLAAELRARPVGDDERDPGARACWNALYESVRVRDDWRHTLRRCLAGLAYENRARIEPSALTHVLDAPFAASVSRLERFAACPFAHFAEYMLDLEPRVEADMRQLDLGKVCHAILETFIADLTAAGASLTELADDEIAERIDAIARDVVPQVADDVMLDDARNAYLFDRSRSHLHRVTRWQRDAARAGRFRPRAVEYPFGLSGSPAAPLRLATPGGRTILLRGVIDRVDVADLADGLLGTVIDYKHTTQRNLDLTKVYHGLALQLVGYLLALEQLGESLTGRPIRPVAAFYLPLIEPYKPLDHPDDERTETFKWRGIADVSALETLDSSIEPGQRSRFMSACVSKKTGEPYANSDLAKPDQLSALMAHVGRRMGELADALLDGNIDVAPYRLRRSTPCSWCAYKPVCRYEIDTQPPRGLDSLKRAEVLRRVVEEQPDG